jgi:ubiquinone/menaquinone biosynthesis C-methylase UbiE
VARETGATLTGLDVSPVAMAQAAGRVAAFGLVGRARFQIGDLAATGLPEAAFDGAMSVDALWLARDKPAALREVARYVAHRAALGAELGEAVTERVIAQHHRGVARFPGWQRIFVVARLGR